MRIVPVNFNTDHKAMLGHCKMILESEGGRIAINPDKFDKVITALRTAVVIVVSLSKGRVIDSFVDATRSTFKITKFIFDLAALPKIFWVSATEIINSGSPSRVFQTLA
jgi:kynureninase